MRSRIGYSDADYFSPAKADQQRARAQQLAKGPTPEQVQFVLDRMPHQSAVEKRNRALIAFTLLTGARVSAIASLRLKHVDLHQGSVFQDAREVATKNSKTFTTWFFPVGDEIRTIFEQWVTFLQNDQLFGPDDPLFPATLVQRGKSSRFENCGLDRKPWSSAARINLIFKSAFEEAGLPYFNPHSFRNTLARLGYELCRGDMKALKVWSQNFAHESMLVTYLGYGTVGPSEHGDIMRNLRAGMPSRDEGEAHGELKALLRRALEVEEKAENRSPG